MSNDKTNTIDTNPSDTAMSDPNPDSTQKKTTRYELLTKLIDMTLSRSRSSLNMDQMVRDTYGSDASIFGGQEILEGIVDNMLDKMEDTVKERINQHMEKLGVKTRLDEIEDIIHELEEEARRQQQSEQDDIDSARQAFDQAVLPEGVNLGKAIHYVAYQKKLEHKEQLAKALQDMEDEIAALKNQQEEAESKVRKNSQKLQQVAQTLEKSADVCSMVTAAS
ncbi:unnamed protein product [Cylindrotheca closterium]|uniref:Uncharacterized protein n=1 Tax=Cylindrotheca closterium TaxID=2856 RepID=A0AAD2PUY8_9STRA|nr:unnamed protein product [Cylindrotheca closterium]